MREQRTGEVFRLLDHNIGYADLERLEVAEERVHVARVGHVVAVVGHRGTEERREPQGVDAQQLAVFASLPPLVVVALMSFNVIAASLGLALGLAAALLVGRRIGNRRPASVIRFGFVLVAVGIGSIIPLVPRVDSGWWLVIPLVVAGTGLGRLGSQLNNYTRAPIE